MMTTYGLEFMNMIINPWLSDHTTHTHPHSSPFFSYPFIFAFAIHTIYQHNPTFNNHLKYLIYKHCFLKLAIL